MPMTNLPDFLQFLGAMLAVGIFTSVVMYRFVLSEYATSVPAFLSCFFGLLAVDSAFLLWVLHL